MAADTATARPEVSSGSGRGGLWKFLFVHEIDEYPGNGKRTGYLGLAVIATIVLYYTYYTQTGVTPNILVSYHMSFAFYVWIVVISNAIGAFASLPASKTDKLGRSNVVIYGLLIIGLLVAVGVPLCQTEWQFATVICVLGLVEGAILVATPALVRDFSPQLGRASAMGFWTVGPVAGSLITSIVAAHTLDGFIRNHGPDAWKSQFIISGVTALVVFVLSLLFLKDLSSRLRDQLMVSEHDQALVEARARGLSDQDVMAATAHPWRQILKWDLVGTAVGISVFLLLYYAASAFFTIYWATVFKNPNGLNLSTSQANDLNTWFWAADIVALIVFGVLSDVLKVRKPLMLVGAIGSIVMLYFFIQQRQPPVLQLRPDHLHRGAPGRLHLPDVRPVDGRLHRDGGSQEPGPGGDRPGPLGLDPPADRGAVVHLPAAGRDVRQPGGRQPALLADHDQRSAVQRPAVPDRTPAVGRLRRGQRQLAEGPPGAEGRADRGGPQHQPHPGQPGGLPEGRASVRLHEDVANATKLKTLVVPYEAQLGYLATHQTQLNDLLNGVSKSPKQWQNWFWICMIGMVLFIPTIWLNRGRWSPSKARQDEAKHEADVQAELKQLVGANA